MRSKVKVKRYRADDRPHLKFVVNFKEDGGQRRRQYFETRDEADSFALRWNTRLVNQGREAVSEFNGALRVMAQEWADKLAQHGKTIADAGKYLIEHLKKTARSITVAALVDEVIAKKRVECRHGQPAKRAYANDLVVRLGRFKNDFADRPTSSFDSLEIGDWLDGLKNKRNGAPLSRQGRTNYAKALGTAFSYAVKRRYIDANPLKEIEKPKGGTKPEILTVEQLARLLEAASDDLLPYVAISAFAGLRPSEVKLLDWADINFEENFIKVNCEGKTGERHVDMMPNLVEWLLPLRKAGGRITPKGFWERFDALRAKAKIAKWPNNAFRHSFASYHLAHLQNDALTRLQMGHAYGSAILFAHYRRAVSRKDGARYWALKPVAASNVVPIKTAA
jgi:integrase